MIQANRLKALKNVLGSWLGLGSTVIAGFALTPYVLHHVGDSAYGYLGAPHCVHGALWLA